MLKYRQSVKDSIFIHNRYIYIWLFTFMNIAIALPLIHFIEYGLYLVVCYLIYTVENIKSHQFLNVLESNEHIGKLYAKISEQEKQLEELSNKIEILEHKNTNI